SLGDRLQDRRRGAPRGGASGGLPRGRLPPLGGRRLRGRAAVARSSMDPSAKVSLVPPALVPPGTRRRFQHLTVAVFGAEEGRLAEELARALAARGRPARVEHVTLRHARGFARLRAGRLATHPEALEAALASLEDDA